MKTLFTLMLPLFLFAPNISEQSDKGVNPNWVTEIMDKKPKFTQITRCVYEDEYVWKVNPCVTCNDMITKIYDIDKNLICQYGGILRQNTCNDKGIELDDCRVIYKPKTTVNIGL